MARSTRGSCTCSWASRRRAGWARCSVPARASSCPRATRSSPTRRSWRRPAGSRPSSYDRGEKKAVYERNAVAEYWLVDPRARTLTLFTLREGRFDGGRVFAAHERCASLVLPGLELAVGELFP